MCHQSDSINRRQQKRSRGGIAMDHIEQHVAFGGLSPHDDRDRCLVTGQRNGKMFVLHIASAHDRVARIYGWLAGRSKSDIGLFARSALFSLGCIVVWLLLYCLIIAPTLIFRPVIAASELTDTFSIGQAIVAFLIGAASASRSPRRSAAHFVHNHFLLNTDDYIDYSSFDTFDRRPSTLRTSLCTFASSSSSQLHILVG